MILKEWWQRYVPLRLRAMGVEVGQDVRFYGMPIVRVIKGSRIRLGDRVVLCSDSRFTDLGVNHPVVLRTLRPGARIVIGDNTGISGGAICAANAIEVGEQCLLGANVTVVDTDFHATKPEGRRFNNDVTAIATAPVYIEHNVFLGTGAIVLKGVRVGENSIIGAGAIVVKNVPANEVWGGNPAQHISDLTQVQTT
jgi:acetyltransferase-like isoleucine patch superfamily enzyme